MIKQALLLAEEKFAETIRARDKEKAMLLEQIGKLQTDLNSSGKQVRFLKVSLRNFSAPVLSVATVSASG